MTRPQLFEALTPPVVGELFRGVDNSDPSIPLGDGLRVSDLLAGLTKLPGPSQPEAAAQVFVFVLEGWSIQQHLRADGLLVRNENSKLAHVLCWLAKGLPIDHTVAAETTPREAVKGRAGKARSGS